MNASDGLRLTAWKHPEKTAAVCFDKRCTYKGLDERANRLANGLLAKGFKRGDKVAYMLYNSMEGLEIIQALLRVGMTLVPINYRLNPDHMGHIINHCDANCLFLGEDLLNSVEPFMPKLTNIPRQNYIIIGDQAPQGMSRYEDIMSESTENPEVEAKPADIAYIAYTSGTTGLPKGVATSSRALMSNMRNA
ncbi:AMP-binding protein, partial [Chloroflexota bacterium]